MDLIDRAEVLHKFLEILPDSYNLDWYEEAKPDEVKELADELYSIVLNANQIDAQPVKRGNWVDIGQLQGLKCSNCGKRASYKNGTPCLDVYWAFCPKCGAKMDGDSGD